MTEVEKINIENHLNTTEVLVFSFLGGELLGGLIGANQPEHEGASRGEWNHSPRFVSTKTANIVGGVLLGGALGLSAGILVDLAFRRTDSIIFVDPEDKK